ncbi:GAF domain-containing sensor histidine kinase [Pararobbsia silviterrae]|uniref:histidine kinase n=1 Tax=Pararobbsia silviterrae TaxID=1792498 RepID=A0A494XDH4_9BURK|nr:GAF domain-containing sensor histidine kinase [Pararobbsia silviterrae]RKP47721.1 GAF domain-containing sensor histidine kinase [Pararobbsia silviterrae]
MSERDEAIADVVAAVNRISVIPAMLRVICKHTGLGFAAVARVTDDSWTACAVQDNINFGLRPGGSLDIRTTLCLESRTARRPVVIDHASNDPIYRDHPTPRIYHIESYISVPIILPSGEYFGNLCAVDPRPAVVSDSRTISMFTLFAELIALQLDNEDRMHAPETERRAQRSAAELREHYLTLLGHDLRDPVESIGSIALALQTSEPHARALGAQLEATRERMARTVDHMIDFTSGRLGSGIEIDKRPVDDLGTVFEAIIAEHRAQHPGRVLDTAVTIDRPVVCDRARVRQLLSNLLDNALTYGPADTRVTVEAHIERGMLLIRVCNSGRPIPQHALVRIFEPHARDVNHPRGKGLGLGLYVCGQIVNAHAGSLQVSSSAEHGTCFVALLPIGK